MRLEDNKKFREEFERFQNQISQITNENLKLELSGLLKDMLSEVRLIDQQHNQLFERKSLPTTVVDNRSKLLEIRKKIEKKLKDWSRA